MLILLLVLAFVGVLGFVFWQNFIYKEPVVKEVEMIKTQDQSKASELELLGVYDFVTPSGTTNNFVTYSVRLNEPYEIILEDTAHSEYRWVSVEEANQMPDLIFGLHDLFKMVGYIK